MPNGRVHFVTNVVCGLAMTGAAAWYAPELTAPVAVGSIIGAFVTPDADVDHTTHSEALLRRIPVVGLLFQLLWYPYALLHGHRGASHWPVLGTLGRLAYMAVVAALVGVFVIGWFALLGSALPEVTLPQATWSQAAWLLAAWIAQDLTHIALDSLIRG